jgi:WD40 repeat protein
MSILFTCRCGKKLTLNDAVAGKKLMCPACQKWSIVPDPNQAVPITPVEDVVEALPVSPTTDPSPMPPAGKREVLSFDEDSGGTYGVKTDDASAEGGRSGGAAADALGFGGEMGCYRLSRVEESVQCVAYAANDRSALAGLDNLVHVLDVKEGTKAGPFREHRRAVTALAFSPDSRFVLSGDESGGIALWELAGRQLIKWLDGHREPVTALAFTPNGMHTLSACAGGLLLLWDLRRGEEVACLQEGRSAVHRIVFAPDGRRVLTAGAGGNVRVWDAESAHLLGPLRGADGTLTAAAISADGARAWAARASCSATGGVEVWCWNLVNGDCLPCFADPTHHLAETTCVAFSPEGTRLLSAGFVRASKESSDRRPAGVDEAYRYGLLATGIVAAAYHVRDNYLNKRHVINVWDTATGQIVQTLEGHQGTIEALALSHTGRRCLSGAKDGTVRAWSVS